MSRLFSGGADLVGRFSFAQAEYFYDADQPKQEWLWHMNWRA